MEKEWYKSKTIWSTALAVITAVGAFVMGEIDVYTLLTTVFAGGIVASIRDAMK